MRAVWSLHVRKYETVHICALTAVGKNVHVRTAGLVLSNFVSAASRVRSFLFKRKTDIHHAFSLLLNINTSSSRACCILIQNSCIFDIHWPRMTGATAVVATEWSTHYTTALTDWKQNHVLLPVWSCVHLKPHFQWRIFIDQKCELL